MEIKDRMAANQKLVARFAGNKAVLLLIAAYFTLTSMLPAPTNFSGKWKLNESKSNRGHSICTWGLEDHMRSYEMKVAAQTKFLIITVVTTSPEGKVITTQEKLTIDGRENQFNLIGRDKTSVVKWSADRQTMTINSVLDIGPVGVKTEYKVIAVWKLINNGKNISIQANIKSIHGEDFMNLIFDKVTTYSQTSLTKK